MSIEEKIKVSADTSGLKEIERDSRKAFDPRNTREFKREAKELEREYVNLNRRIIDLGRSMRGLDKGTDAFRDMRTGMRNVQREAKEVQAAIEAINRVTQPRPGRGAGVAGLAQGLGIAQYIPTGPGMGRRMVGAGVGGLLRRGAGGAAAPFLTPGMGGMAQMLSALPGGGIAGGALQAASAYYQEAVGFQRQRLENLPFISNLGGRIERSRIAAQEAAAKTTKVLSPSERMQIIGEEASAAAEKMRFSRGAGEAATRVAITRMPPMAMGFAPGYLRPTIKEVKSARQEIDAREVERAEKRVEERFKTENRERREEARKAIAAAATRAFGRTRLLGPGGLGAQMGFRAGEVQQMTGAFMQARGGELTRDVQGELKEALVARRRFGLGAEVAGGFQRMFAPGGGGTGQISLSRALGAAVTQGLEGSRITEYMQDLVAMGKSAEQRGIKINAQDFIRSTAALTAMGMGPGQAGRIMGGIQTAAQRVSTQGVQGPMDLLLMRAAGWTPGQGVEGYARAKNIMAGGLTPEMMQRLMGMVTAGAGGIGGPETQAMRVRQAMGAMGVQIGPEQARFFLQSFQEGELTEEAKQRLQDITAAGVRRGDVGQFRKEAAAGVGRVGGLVRREAGLEAQRISAGAQYGGLMAKMQESTLGSVNALSKFKGSLEGLADAVTAFMGKLGQLGEWIESLNWGGGE